MSSNTQFSHGLNNWVDSDKPTRSDFVADNQLLNEGALWKAEFDPKANAGDETGPVAVAGGIAAYAMAKADYDADGAIAEAGGLGEFVEGLMNDEMMTKSAYAPEAEASYDEAGKILTVESLHPHPQTAYNLQFTAPADYNRQQTFVVDGEAMEGVFGANGRPVGGKAWVAGVPVQMRREGTRLYLAAGSGGGVGDMNIAVVGGAERPNPDDYGQQVVVWVPGAEAEPVWVMQPGAPTLQNGGVWIPLTASSFNIVDIYEGGNIRASLGPPELFTGGVWATQMNAEIYTAGVWNTFVRALFDNGEMIVPGVFNASHPNDRARITDNLIELYAYGTSSSSSYVYVSFNAVDVTPFNTVVWEIERFTGTEYPTSTDRNVGLTSAQTVVTSSATKYASLTRNIYNQTYEMDISSLSGMLCVGATVHGYGGGSQTPLLRISRVYLK